MNKAAKFRREWILDPSKEMIVESEIIQAYANQEVRQEKRDILSTITIELNELRESANIDEYSFGELIDLIKSMEL